MSTRAVKGSDGERELQQCRAKSEPSQGLMLRANNPRRERLCPRGAVPEAPERGATRVLDSWCDDGAWCIELLAARLVIGAPNN